MISYIINILFVVVFTIITVKSIMWLGKCIKENPYGDVTFKDTVFLVFAVIAWFIEIGAIVVFIINTCGIIDCNVTAVENKVKYEQRYEVLIYQLENNVYAQDDKLVEMNADTRYKLYNDVRYWNEEVATNQEKCTRAWDSIFTPKFYLDLKLIDLNDYPNLLKVNSTDSTD